MPSPEEHGREPEEYDREPEGGDPACWAHLVCPVCGRIREGREPHACTGDLPVPDAGSREGSPTH